MWLKVFFSIREGQKHGVLLPCSDHRNAVFPTRFLPNHGSTHPVSGLKKPPSAPPTSLTSSSRPGYWFLDRRAAAGDLWWVMVTMLLGEAVWLRCLWEPGDEDGLRWGRREKLRVRPEDEEPWDWEGRGREGGKRRGIERKSHRKVKCRRIVMM